LSTIPSMPPALRLPPEVSRHFGLVLTGAQWQSDEVDRRHLSVLKAIMPIGPEFASPETFLPVDSTKLYDVIYVAAAQAYNVMMCCLRQWRAHRAPQGTLCHGFW